MDKVAFPTLSRLKDDPVRYRTYFVKYCSTVAFFSMPLVAVLYAGSDDLIMILLGPAWEGAADLFGVLAIAAFLQPVAGLRGMVLLSNGSGRRYFYWGVCNALIALTAILAGLPWGAGGVAVAYCLAGYVQLHPSLIYTLKGTAVRPADFYAAVAKPAIAAVCGGAAGVVLRASIPHEVAVLSLLATAGVTIATYLSVYAVLPRGARDLLEQAGYLWLLLTPLQAAAPARVGFKEPKG
jgi:O-antigen/teichoic acid export membrane protein